LQKQTAIAMKQYTQEEIDFIQRWMNGERNVEPPSVEELNDIQALVNQGKLNPTPWEYQLGLIDDYFKK